MNPEEFGITKGEELEIRAHAVLGAIRDASGPYKPEGDETRIQAASAKLEEHIPRIMEEYGVSDTEARLMMAEHLMMSRSKGE